MSLTDDRREERKEAEAARKSGRPTNKQLDDRSEQLDGKAADLERREKDLAARMMDIRPMTEPEPMDDDAELGPNMRRSVGRHAQRQTHGLHNPKAIRKPMGNSKRLDADIYNELYPDAQLMWINDRNGSVQRWINEGAEPVPVQTRAARIFEGITDAHESKWVRAIGGEDRRGHYWVYLLMIDPQIYYEVKIAPERERQRMIREAILSGMDRSDYSQGPKLPSYKPNLPTGEGQGFAETRETIAHENS